MAFGASGWRVIAAQKQCASVGDLPRSAASAGWTRDRTGEPWWLFNSTAPVALGHQLPVQWSPLAETVTSTVSSQMYALP
jgi:hypothetical protein